MIPIYIIFTNKKDRFLSFFIPIISHKVIILFSYCYSTMVSERRKKENKKRIKNYPIISHNCQIFLLQLEVMMNIEKEDDAHKVMTGEDINNNLYR